ncbi:related to GTPase activating protein [Ustilago trichophora]|uniref:Related to GTPase activating protein n=1 Tax=Ustilago trichophora TaxID=86804 RepID=A0A5C3E0M6_9BASI|nr:related to GTPase activating protein [Ustilago trichophora]
MSGPHPLWPDYAPHSIARSPNSAVSASASSPAASSAISSASTPHSVLPRASTSSLSSSRRIPGNLPSTPSSPPSHAFRSTSSSSSAYTARDEFGDSIVRRPKRTSLDRSQLQATSVAATAAHPILPTRPTLPKSPSALASPIPTTQSRHAVLVSQPTKQSPNDELLPTCSASSSVCLPSSSSFSSSSSSSPAAGGSRDTDATARDDRALPCQALHTHTLDDSASSYTHAQLPTTSSISSSPSSLPHHNQPLASNPSPSSRYAAPIPSSSSSLTLKHASSSIDAHINTPRARDMRYNIAAIDPPLPPSSFASRRDASFSRLRSGSGSNYGPSRTAPPSDAEVSIHVLIWWPSTSKSASSTLARAPLFRDAANVKQKLSMRSSSSQNRPSEQTHDHLFERASFGFRHGGASWLREKPSKSRLNSPSSSVGPLGQWKRAILLFRENGSLSIFGEGNALTHTLQCGALTTSDVRCVDDSLFGRPHVLSIQPRQKRARTEVSITTPKQEAALHQERARSSEPIFIEFKSEEHLQYVRALLLIYVRPEIYGSPVTIDHGGTHRFFRQLDITISDAKSIMPKWPTELAESTPDPSATSPSSFSNHPLSHSHYPASPTSATAAGAVRTSSEVPRSLSHQLASMRFDDQDDSPGSEALTEDALSGSSRAGSRPGSRPGSRLRHNAKPSVSSIRAHHDFDENAGSGSSRPASRAASHYDSQSLAGDDTSSVGEHISGPLSGHAGASRFVNIPAAVSETAPSLSASIGATSSYAAASRASAQRRDDKDRFEKARFDRYCRIRLDGELVARTSLLHSSANTFAVDKFQLKDIGDVKSLVIEVLHPTQKTSSSLAGSPSQSAVKYILLGLVEIPIETLRRNDEIEGRFPIWSASTFPSLSQQHPSSPTGADEDDGKVPTSFHRGVVGELSLSIRLHEGAVMPLSMYEEVYHRIHDIDAADIVRELATTMREDLIISHLIRIYAASGTVAERISSLIESESVNWGEKMEPELLFRANTLLSRSVDHFQRLLALSWLDDCLGPTVRKICHDPNAPSRPDTAMSSGSAGSGGGEEGHFDFSTSIRSPPLLPANAIDAIPDGPMTTNSLRKLSESMWQNIYRQRHSCPPDLRTVLHQIRCKVNERYRDSKSKRPGIQGVGAFVFLRLFCAALNAPQLYGLTPSQPGRSASRKLLLLSKVLLALASKKEAFDKDKDWELVPLNDLLRTYSSAYDDYISVVSTEPPTAAPMQLLGVRMDDDADLQAAVERKLSSLSPIHRESIPTVPYMLDQPQALGSFVCFIADAAEQREQKYSHYDVLNGAPLSEGQHDDTAAASSASEGETSRKQSDAERIRQKTNEFIQICCQIEEVAGMCIEQAGYDPRPLPFERLQRAAMLRYGGAAAASSSSPARGGDGGADTTVASFSSSTSSFGTVIQAGGEAGDASPRSSPGRTRSRRATVSNANARSRMAGATSERDGRHGGDGCDGVDMGSASPRGARRKSLGLPRSGRRPSQTMTDGNVMPAYTSTANRYTFTPRKDEEDDHGSDDELRQAYRMLRAEEASATMPSGMATAETVRVEEPEANESLPALGLEPMGALLEAEDGSTFMPVYPQGGSASAGSAGPPLSRSARQSVELGRPGPGYDAQLASRKLGSRASFTAASSNNKQHSVATSANDRSNKLDTSRRHSLDRPVPRNYSLPQPLADRKSSTQYDHEMMRESSDGFESVLEDAYAQTRATLPPSASMPTVAASTARYANATSGSGEAKRKKWWKP